MGQITFRKSRSHFGRCSMAIFLGHPIMELAPKRMSCLHRFPPRGRVWLFMPRQKIVVTITIDAGTTCFHDCALSCSMLFPGRFLGWDRFNRSHADMQSLSNHDQSFPPLGKSVCTDSKSKQLGDVYIVHMINMIYGCSWGCEKGSGLFWQSWSMYLPIQVFSRV